MIRTAWTLSAAVLLAGPLAGQQRSDACDDETTAGLRRCLAARLAAADSALAGALAAAREQAQAPRLLDSAHTAWRRYVELDCRAAADVFRGGSLAPVVAASCRLDHVVARTRFLRQDYGGAPGRRGFDEAAEPDDSLTAVEDRRFQALVAGDTAALRELLAEELSYTHTGGTTHTREGLIADLARGALRYQRLAAENREVRRYGQAAVITGTAASRAGTPEPRDFRIRYLAVYLRRDERWVLAAWQSTRLP